MIKQLYVIYVAKMRYKSASRLNEKNMKFGYYDRDSDNFFRNQVHAEIRCAKRIERIAFGK